MAQARHVLIWPGDLQYVKYPRYLYKEVGLELWRCNRPSAKWKGPMDHVLWLFRQDDIWMAVHAPMSCSSIAEIAEVNATVWASWESSGKIRFDYSRTFDLEAPRLEPWHLHGIGGLISMMSDQVLFRTLPHYSENLITTNSCTAGFLERLAEAEEELHPGVNLEW